MKKLFIRISAIFTVIILILSASFIPSLAADSILFIENKSFNDISKDLSGSGWSWKASSYTLTLDGYDGGMIVFKPSNNAVALKIVVKNKNKILFDREDTSSFSESALTIWCNTEISGNGTLSLNAPIKESRGIFFGGKATVSDVKIDISSIYNGIFGYYGKLKFKNCHITFDSNAGFGLSEFLFEGCNFIYKNTVSKDSKDPDAFCVSGNGVFKNCTIDVTLGARSATSSEPVRCHVFNGCIANLDNTVLRVKKAANANIEYAIVYPLLYPEMERSIAIKNNSKIEVDDSVDSVIRCYNTEINDSAITGVTKGQVLAAYNLKIKNSVLDVDVIGKGDGFSNAIEATKCNIENSKIKAKSIGCVWNVYDPTYSHLDSVITLTDTELDFESGKPSFGDGYKLNYTNPDEWAIEINGKPSDKTVRSSDIDFAQNRVVIKRVDKIPPKPVSSSSADTSDKTNVGSNPAASEPSDSSESAVPEETSEPDIENETEDEKDESNEVDTDVLTDGAIEEKAPEKSLWIILGAVAALVVVVGAAAVILLKFKKK